MQPKFHVSLRNQKKPLSRHTCMLIVSKLQLLDSLWSTIISPTKIYSLGELCQRLQGSKHFWNEII